jgi:hypothetical protein
MKNRSPTAADIIARVQKGEISTPGNVNPRLWAQGLLLRAGRKHEIDEDEFVVRKRYHYERVTIPAAVPTTISLHNGAVTPFVRTIGNNKIPTSTIFYMKTVRMKLERGIDIAGAIVATNDGYSAGAPAAMAGFDQIEDVRRIMEALHFNLRVGQRDLISDMRGLYNFPQGGGVEFDLAAATGGANAQNVAVAQERNGVGLSSNAFGMYPYLISEADPIYATLTNQAAFTNSAPYVLTVVYEGDEITGSKR